MGEDRLESQQRDSGVRPSPCPCSEKILRNADSRERGGVPLIISDIPLESGDRLTDFPPCLKPLDCDGGSAVECP